MKRFSLLTLFVFGCASPTKTIDGPTDGGGDAAVAPKVAEVAAVKSQIQLAGSIELMSVKNETAPVPLQFAAFEASLLGVQSSPGVYDFEDAALILPFADLSSGLDIRDQRVRDTFFHATENPNARFEVARMTLSAEAAQFEGKLVIGPFSQALTGEFSVLKASDEAKEEVASGAIAVESSDPIVVSIASLGMGERLKALMELCGHQSITDAVKVSAKGHITVSVVE